MASRTDDDNLTRKFQEWNPLQEAYANAEFNTYKSGPGARLDPALQKQEKTRKTDAQVPFLVFRNMPKEITRHVVANMCKHHGKITDVRFLSTHKMYFVDCATVADMEAIWRALSDNKYGFKVDIGKTKKKKENQLDEPVFMPNTRDAVQKIDKENRNIYVPEKKHVKRSTISTEKVPKVEDYNDKNSLLLKNDPQRQLLNCTEDAHELERNGVLPENLDLRKFDNQMKKVCNGRVYVDVPNGISNYMITKFGTSTGELSSDGKEFIVNSNEINENPIDLGKCEICGVICNFVCARCGRYYCGSECQKKAWPKHRYTCGKADGLQYLMDNDEKQCAESVSSSTITTSSSIKKSQLITSFPMSGNMIELTSINKTNIVFFRSKSYEANHTYFKTLTAVQDASKNLGQPLQALPKCGEVVFCEFQGKFNRAIVMGVLEGTQVKINYMDYGNVDVKPFTELYAAPEKVKHIPRLTQPVLLKGVPDCYMNDEIRACMYNYLNANLIIKYDQDTDFVKERGVYQAELIDEEIKQSLNDRIVELVNVKQPENGFEVYHINNLQVVDLPTNAGAEYVVMDNTMLNVGYISCTTKTFALEIEKFQRDIQRYAATNELEGYAPRVDELCIAQYDGDEVWYRGRCLELVGDGHPSIEFIDFGNIACVNVQKILRIPKEFLFPIFTHNCEIEGLPLDNIGDALITRLEDLLPISSFIKCDTVDYSKEFNIYTITMRSVIETLKDEGLLKEEADK